jgi:hypothetical protein
VRFATALIVALLFQGTVETTKPATRETNHLRVALSASADRVAPGGRVTLRVDVTPKPKMHVYAPGQPDYVTVSLKFDANPAFTAAKPQFPPPEKFLFEPLNEQQLVYMKPFRITTDVTLSPTARGDVTVKGTFRYQACDDHVCYLPANVPVEWTIPLIIKGT